MACREPSAFARGRKQPVMPDSLEAVWQDVEQEAIEKDVSMKGQDTPSVAMGGVAPERRVVIRSASAFRITAVGLNRYSIGVLGIVRRSTGMLRPGTGRIAVRTRRTRA